MNDVPTPQPYLLKLEWLMKAAILVYAVILVAEAGYIALTLDAVVQLLSRSARVGLYIAGLVTSAAILVWRIRAIARIAGLNVWLDRRMFGLLKACDAILSDTILASAEAGRDIVLPHDPMSKATLAKTVIDRLARHKKILPGLMDTGIYTLWIWYWIMMYGTVVFSFLTAGTFIVLLLHAGTAIKPVFFAVWGVALAHVAAMILIGLRLKRMTRDAAAEISASYASDIDVYIRDGRTAAPAA